MPDDSYLIRMLAGSLIEIAIIEPEEGGEDKYYCQDKERGVPGPERLALFRRIDYYVLVVREQSVLIRLRINGQMEAPRD
jgi:hypothetical protein